MRTGVELVTTPSPAMAMVPLPNHKQLTPHRTPNDIFMVAFRFLVASSTDTQRLSRPARKALIDKSCPGIASINVRRTGWNRIEPISQEQGTGRAMTGEFVHGLNRTTYQGCGPSLTLMVALVVAKSSASCLSSHVSSVVWFCSSLSPLTTANWIPR